MNAINDLWLRASVVTASTTALLVLAIAALAIFPFGRPELPSPQSRPVEAGLVYLPPSAPSPSEPQHPAEVPAPVEPIPAPRAEPVLPPAPPEPAIPIPEKAIALPVPHAEEPRPEIHKTDPPKTLPPPVNPAAPTESVKSTPVPTVSAAKPGPSGAPAQNTGAQGGTGAAGAVYKPLPVIPPELRRHAMDLVAVVRFTIAVDGRPKVDLEEATADPQINQILLDTFRRWRFFPAMQEGKPVPSVLILRVPVKVE